MSNYVCKGCAATVQMNHDHGQSPMCAPDATVDEWGCTGTFIHPGGRAAKACSQGMTTLTHEHVMTRDDYNAKIAEYEAEARTNGDSHGE